MKKIKSKKKFWYFLWGVLIVSLIYLFVIKTPEQKRGEIALPTPENLLAGWDFEKEHVFGEVGSAKVFVIEYADPECPYCKLFHGKFKEELITPYDESIAWVYRHRLLPHYDRSLKEAQALECAADQEGNAAFWSYLDALFATTPSGNKLDPGELPRIAADLGLDVPEFETCLSEETFREKVEAQSQESIQAGATLTPSVLIWNKAPDEQVFISGANSRFAEVKAHIERMLSEK